MINTGLDRKYQASASAGMDFSPIPDGEYVLCVKEITKWTPKKQTIKVIQRDENGKALKDEKGDNITETVQDCEFYNCTVKLEIMEGEYAGRLIFHNLSTHPNMPFAIPNFLFGVGMEELAAGEIQEYCVGKECIGVVDTRTYTKTVQNKDTGIDEEVEKKVNNIKSFKQLPKEEQIDIENALNDMGI